MPVSISGNGAVTGINAGSLDVVSTDDTGAPWQVPYLDGGVAGSLAAADEAQALAIAAGLTNASLIRQVVSTLFDDTFSTTSTTFTDITGFSASITPETATNKVLVFVTLGGSHSVAGNSVAFQLRRGSTDIAIPPAGTFIGSIVSRIDSTALIADGSVNVLDSPGVATAVTYQMRMRVGANTGFVNRTGADVNVRRVSSITLIEVAA